MIQTLLAITTPPPAAGAHDDVMWLLITGAGTMAAILGVILKMIASQVINKLDEIVAGLRQLTNITTIQREQIKHLQEQDTTLRRRLYNHAERIRSIELKIVKEAA